MSQYHVLPTGTLDSGTSFQRPKQSLPDSVSLDSPAIYVMTDLSMVTAQTMSPNASVADAEEKMISSGVRLLLVTNPLNQVIGIISAKDLSGERILRLINDTNTARNDLIVRDIMVPQHKIDMLEMADVAKARVGDLVMTLKRMGRQHALVVDRDAAGRQTIRGVLSTTQIGRQLGEQIDTNDVAGNFAALTGSD